MHKPTSKPSSQQNQLQYLAFSLCDPLSCSFMCMCEMEYKHAIIAHQFGCSIFAHPCHRLPDVCWAVMPMLWHLPSVSCGSSLQYGCGVDGMVMSMHWCCHEFNMQHLQNGMSMPCWLICVLALLHRSNTHVLHFNKSMCVCTHAACSTPDDSMFQRRTVPSRLALANLASESKAKARTAFICPFNVCEHWPVHCGQRGQTRMYDMMW